MGRTKTPPRRKSRTITIIGTAAHAALASVSSPLSTEYYDGGDEAIVAAIVTPEKDTKKRRLKKKYGRSVEEDDEDEGLFEESDRKRVRFACGVDGGKDDAAATKTKRRLVFEDDDDDDDEHQGADETRNSLTIQRNGNETIISVPTPAYRVKSARASPSYELAVFQIPSAQLILLDNYLGSFNQGSSGVYLTNTQDVKILLQYCNEQMSATSTLDVQSIIGAFENEILEIGLQQATTNKTHHISISVSLLPIDLLDNRLTQNVNKAPPIPSPRRLPASRDASPRFSEPHPSYTLIQALGTIFRGSIFDDVAKSCVVNTNSNCIQKQTHMGQRQKDKHPVISAGMVYSAVDNIHARQFEQTAATDESSTRANNTVNALNIPGLAPTLRPYQEAAVRWMIERETINSSQLCNDEWELCWYVIIADITPVESCTISAQSSIIVPLPEWKTGKSSGDDDQRHIFCNPFAGWVASSYEHARYLTTGVLEGEAYHPMGGILAESMGLGKSVEVIACMLANPSPLAMIGCSTTDNEPSNLNLPHEEEAISLFQSRTIIESRATLIVTPPSILAQWEREINRHARSLKVVVYLGIKDISDSPLINPRVLADADVVLVTFQTLNSDLGHTDENPYTGDGGSRLRSRKRHVVLPSPLSSIKWHRVCLDEAQKVEVGTTASARMARKLIANRRWCVSGTPIGRGRLNDLYGLFLFLSFKPFDEKHWFTGSFSHSQGDVVKRLSHLLRKVMWRSTKQNNRVREQMGIPEQVETKVVLHFSSVEKYFYNQQYEEALGAVHMWSAAGRPDKLHLALNKLRAACCHPQVGSSGITGRGRHHGSTTRSVLSMDEILNRLIDQAKGRCEDTQRLVIMHTNGMANLSKLKAELSLSSEEKQQHLLKSLRTYQEALDIMDKNSSPSLLVGSAGLSGSVGFRYSGKVVSCDSFKLDWKISPTGKGEAWSAINFVDSKRVSCAKVRCCDVLSTELKDENHGSWHVLQPKKIVLQMKISNASDGGGFVDVGSISVPKPDCEQDKDRWIDISGFRAEKSKAARIVIQSYHNLPSTAELEGATNYYVGLEVQLLEPRISADPLQKLHTLANASIVLSSLLQPNNDNIVEENTVVSQARLDEMDREGQFLSYTYMAHAKAVHSQRKNELRKAKLEQEKCEQDMAKVSCDSGRSWYEDALSFFSLYGNETQQHDMYEAVTNALQNYYSNVTKRSELSSLTQILIRKGRFPGFNNVNGIHAALQLRLDQGQDEVGNSTNADQKQCVTTVMALSSSPTTGDILENACCRRCRKDWHQTGPVCKHCHLEKNLIMFERLANDPEISCVLAAMAKVVKDELSKSSGQNKSILMTIHKRSTIHAKLQQMVREEIKSAKALWRAHFDLLSDIDELNQCKTAMRLQREEEDVSKLSEHEAAFVVDPSNIVAEYFSHEAKQGTALSEMRRREDSMRFLTNERKENRESNVCNICLSSFQQERSVLTCGHFFHPLCVEKLFNKSRGNSIRCPLRCPMITKREEILVASSKSKHDGSQTHHKIKGDWGTKVNKLISDVIDIVQLGDKGLILSQWDDMLNIVAEGLNESNVRFIRPRSGKRFGEDVRLFRTSDYPILLMNVKNGAEGLTLTEANHCFMLEPILNHSVDAQAINRIHRIGQTAKTYIHRYIVSGTVEEKIDEIRIEREANQYEDDIAVRNKLDQAELDLIFG